MDKIEKIRQEIERRKQSLRAGICNPDAFTRKQKLEMLVASEELNRLNRFLDTLSEEPDKSLEEEIKNYFQGYWPGTDTAEQCNTDLHFTPPAIIRLASHFAQWGAEHTHLPEDTVIFHKGIEEGKRLMMEEARNHFVYNVLSGNDMKKMIEIYNDEVSCKPGNVVRIIVLPKEDEK